MKSPCRFSRTPRRFPRRWVGDLRGGKPLHGTATRRCPQALPYRRLQRVAFQMPPLTLGQQKRRSLERQAATAPCMNRVSTPALRFRSRESIPDSQGLESSVDGLENLTVLFKNTNHPRRKMRCPPPLLLLCFQIFRRLYRPVVRYTCVQVIHRSKRVFFL